MKLRPLLIRIVFVSMQFVAPTHGMSADTVKIEKEIRCILRRTWVQRWFVQEAIAAATMDDDRFRELVRRPNEIEDGVRRLVSEESAEFEEKQLAVRLLQCLDVDRYVEFAAFVLDAVDRKVCTPDVLADVLYPGAAWGAVLVDHVEKPRVRELLFRIREKGNLGESVQARVAGILDGSYADYVRHLREAGVSVPNVSCSSGDSVH